MDHLYRGGSGFPACFTVSIVVGTCIGQESVSPVHNVPLRFVMIQTKEKDLQ